MWALQVGAALPQPLTPHSRRDRHRQRRGMLAVPHVSTGEADTVQAAASARLQHILDGPDLHLMSYPNLGEISGMLERDAGSTPDADAQAMLEAPGRPYAPSGLYFDGPAVFGSLTLLALMLALSFGRVLGVDQIVAKAAKRWRERRREAERWRIIEARQRLERQYDEDA